MNQKSSSTSNAKRKVTIEEMATTRADAKMFGDNKYFTGNPCPSGHIAPRVTANGACTECYSVRAKRKWAEGVRQNYTDRSAVNEKWNASDKARIAKARWKQKDPKRAWAVYATGGAKTRAKAKGLLFDLTSPYLLSITPDTCPVFGTPFVFVGNKTIQPESATLDRLDPAKGYVRGNVIVMSMKANTIKSAYGSEDVQKVAEWLRSVGL